MSGIYCLDLLATWSSFNSLQQNVMHEGFFGPEVRYFWKGTGKLETGDHENVLAQIGFVVTHSQLGREKIFTDYLKSTPALQSAEAPTTNCINK